MTLESNFSGRYSAARTIALTNPDNPAAVAVDGDRLFFAARDTEEEFRRITGLVYDDTQVAHVVVAVLGMEWRLLSYTGSKAAATNTAFEVFEAAALRLARAGGARSRVRPTTTSPLTPSTENTTGKPDQDRDKWSEVVPELRG